MIVAALLTLVLVDQWVGLVEGAVAAVVIVVLLAGGSWIRGRSTPAARAAAAKLGPPH